MAGRVTRKGPGQFPAAVYRISEQGRQLVYKYAGGVGTRYGDWTDVQRLLLADLYQQAMQDRAAKQPEAAAHAAIPG